MGRFCGILKRPYPNFIFDPKDPVCCHLRGNFPLVSFFEITADEESTAVAEFKFDMRLSCGENPDGFLFSRSDIPHRIGVSGHMNDNRPEGTGTGIANNYRNTPSHNQSCTGDQ